MGKRQFKTEVSDLLNLIIHSLYSNREIFLRELISNASDAIDKLKYLSLTDEKLKGFSFDPAIEVRFDSDAKTLTISDNGVGMDEDDLNANLGTIASSGTRKFLENLGDDARKNSNLIGQFGVGFYSAFMVASRVEVVSRKAGQDKAFRWESEGRSSYTVSEAQRAQQGSDIILHLNQEGEEYANRWQLETLIRKYSDHIAYPIWLEYDQEHYKDEKDADGNPVKEIEHKREQINSASALWTRSKSSIKDEEYKDFYKNSYSDSEDPLFYIHTHAEGATEYTTLFYVPAKAPFDMYYADYRPGVKLYVKRVYITDDDKELLPTYLRFVRGIIDSEDLPLNVSREILQENKVMSAIRSGSVKKLLGEFRKIADSNPDLYVKFIEQYNRPLKEGLYGDYANRETLLELVRYKSTAVEGYTSLASYKERMKDGQSAIYYITGGKEDILRNSPLLATYRDYKDLPFKAINKSGAMDEMKDADKSEDEKKDESRLVEKLKKALGDRVKDVVVSSRLSADSAAVIVMDENDPSMQMQRLLKQMGGGADMPEVKPILEVNADNGVIRKIDASDDEEYVASLASIVLDEAYIAEGIMPKDPAAFVRNVTKLLG